LKNIVNIDRFFASGPGDDKKGSFTQNSEPSSSKKVKTKNKKKTKKAAKDEADGDDAITEAEEEITKKHNANKKSSGSFAQVKANETEDADDNTTNET